MTCTTHLNAAANQVHPTATAFLDGSTPHPTTLQKNIQEWLEEREVKRALALFWLCSDGHSHGYTFTAESSPVRPGLFFMKLLLRSSTVKNDSALAVVSVRDIAHVI